MSDARHRGEQLSSHVNVAADRVVMRQVLTVAAFAVVVLALYLDVAIRNDPISVDFDTYVAAARVGLQDGWSHIYDQGLVALDQQRLVPGSREQPFISPPTVAWIVAPLAMLPPSTAYVIWAVITFAAFALAMAFSGISRGLGRWVAVVGALTPWWVMHAVNVGQVVPLVAAGLVIAWRLLRDRRDVLAGIVLSCVLLKPNTAMLVPLALLFATRYRALAAWAATTGLVGLVAIAVLGPHGVTSYVDQMRGPWPSGADNVTLHGALYASGLFAAALRILIVAAVMGGSYLLRGTPGLVMPLATVGSLLVSPYLHGSDLCLLAAAGWMIWEERPAIAWRGLLAGAWLLASPFLYLRGYSPHLTQWPWLEFVIFGGLMLAALGPLTAWADSRRRAPA